MTRSPDIGGLRGFATRHPIATFVLLAYGLSWTAATLALHPRTPLAEYPATFCNHLAKFGPSLAALIVVWLRDGASGARGLLEGLGRFRVSAGWYLLVLLGPLALWLLAAGIRSASGAVELSFDLAQAWVFVPLLLKHTLLGGGLGEEPGWRGFLLPELQAQRSALASAVIIGLVWGLWHLPAFLLPGAGKTGSALGSLLPFSVLTIVLSVLFTWVFNSTRGNLLLVVLLHGAMNAEENGIKALAPMLRGDGGTTLVYGCLLLLCALAAIVFAGPRNLSRRGEARRA